MALINDFLSLIYPRHCEACSGDLFRHERFICTHCKLHLPRSNYHLLPESELKRVFYGRVPLESASSFYLYEKSGKIQKLLHAIKYEDQKELGHYLGKLYGDEISEHAAFQTIDYIIPIPLHKKKLKQRGYNQSEWFAKGLAEALGKTIDVQSLERSINTNTQTRKKKFERWENVDGIFKLKERAHFVNRHVLLVDDVVTTGATIEACWNELRHVPGIKVSLVSIAFAAKH
jgi:ComF family protein